MVDQRTKSKRKPAWSGKRALPALAVIAGVSVLAGCSQVPDAVNPVEWYNAAVGDGSESVEGTPKNELEAERGTRPPGSEQEFPNLARVDQQMAARDQMREGLSADTQGRNYADTVPRQGAEDAQSSLYAEDKPPEAPNVTAQSIAPAPQPSTPVTEAPAPAPVTAEAQPAQPAPQPDASPSPSATASAAPSQPASDPSFGVDDSMRDRLARQLAEIRARAADQGSLLPDDLTSGGQGQPTVIVSSGGIETAMVSGMRAEDAAEVAALPSGQRISNRGGALPLPSGATKVATILFRNGSASLDGNDRRILADVARLQKQEGGTIHVIGHASQRTRNMDPAAHKLANLQVSVKRADTVAAILRNLGVAGDSILTAAVGDNQPIYLEVMPSGEAGNRRTEIFLSDN